MSETVINLPTTAPARREIQNVVDAVPILDTARFEHMQRVARVLASSSMIPETLRTEGRGNDKVPLPFEQILSNCFLVVNQATRWGFDPFAVISCCSVVHGRLSYEGKLVSAVLDAKLGIALQFHFTGNPHGEDFRIYLSDRPFTDEVIADLKPGYSKNGWRIFDGSVAEWKTTGAGTPWTPKNFKRMLIYRGTRDWTRIYESALMLGVYSDDEMLDLMEDARARRATPVMSSGSLVDRLAAAKAPGAANAEGFSYEHITRETETEAQREAGNIPSPPASTADEALASEREPVSTDSEGVQDRMSESTPSLNSDSLQSSVPIAAATKPVADAAPTPDATGTLSDSSTSGPVDDGAQAGNVTNSTGLRSALPEGWNLAYVAALRRAQSKPSLAKYAKAFWAQYGGFDDHKNGPDGATAAAIYDAFQNNFGQSEELAAALREVV